MRRYSVLLSLFLCLAINNSMAQDAQSQVAADLAYADNLYATENYKAALKEYLRVYYHDRDDRFFSVLEKISKCCNAIGMHEQSLKYINQYLRSKTLDEESEVEAYYYKVRLLLDKDPKLAIAELYQISDRIISADPDRYHFYAAMTHYMDDDLQEAGSELSSLSYYDDIPDDHFRELEGQMERTKNKSHLVPRLLSTVVPGLGQAVNGEVQDGINSALINGSMIWIFIHVARNLSLADAIISVTPYLGRFFVGGMKNAMIASKSKQARDKKRLIGEMSALLMNTKMAH